MSYYLLLNLAEDTKVEEKMKKKRIIYLLCSTLNRENINLQLSETLNYKWKKWPFEQTGFDQGFDLETQLI